MSFSPQGVGGAAPLGFAVPVLAAPEASRG